MKVIYLASYTATLNYDNVTYQDLYIKRDIGGDMMEIDLDPYDIIIATPPCNYYSVANWRRETSEYSQKTKHLLPGIIDKLIKLNKPFIVENVRNNPLFAKYNLLNKQCFMYYHGRHTYWTNIPFNPSGISQEIEYLWYKSSKDRQGGENVKKVLEYWLEIASGSI